MQRLRDVLIVTFPIIGLVGTRAIMSDLHGSEHHTVSVENVPDIRGHQVDFLAQRHLVGHEHWVRSLRRQYYRHNLSFFSLVILYKDSDKTFSQDKRELVHTDMPRNI